MFLLFLCRVQEKDQKLKTLEESLQAEQASSSTKDQTVEVWDFVTEMISFQPLIVVLVLFSFLKALKWHKVCLLDAGTTIGCSSFGVGAAEKQDTKGVEQLWWRDPNIPGSVSQLCASLRSSFPPFFNVRQLMNKCESRLAVKDQEIQVLQANLEARTREVREMVEQVQQQVRIDVTARSKLL